MDQNRLKKICEMALESRGITVTEFRALPTQSYDHEQGKWVPDSYSLFLGLRRKDSSELENSVLTVQKYLLKSTKFVVTTFTQEPATQ